MILVVNEKGNVEEGFLRPNNKDALIAYRNSLLEENEYNYDKHIDIIEKSLTSDNLYKTKYYKDGEFLIKESRLDLLKVLIPFELYLHKFERTSIKCKNLRAIEILTRILKDQYTIRDKKLISIFAEIGFMDLNSNAGNSIYNEHTQVGMENLINPENEQDLRSFRNSFPLLEFVVMGEYTPDIISKQNEETIEAHQFNTPLNVVATNTQILFGGPVKTLKKVKTNK